MFSENSLSPSDESSLPGGFRVCETVFDNIVADGLTFSRAAYAASNARGVVVTGSAAQLEGDPRARAMGELHERAATIAAAEQLEVVTRSAEGKPVGTLDIKVAFPQPEADRPYRFARSNGVALAGSWAEACYRAQLELVERDSVLRSWYGGAAPCPIEPQWLPATTSYSWRLYRCEASVPGLHVVFACALPNHSDAPLLRGLACRPSLKDAEIAAVQEAMQSLAFLWGEEIPRELPALQATPMFHLDYYLCPKSHGALLGWLQGGGRSPKESHPLQVEYIDLTPCNTSYFVARAVAQGAIPLVFGDWSPDHVDAMLPHPIP